MNKLTTTIGIVSALLMFPLFALASPAGLVARYHLNTVSNNTAADSSGNKLDGVVKGTLSFDNGKFGNAYDLNGSGYVQTPDDPLLEPQNVTVEAWVNAPSSPGEFRYIVSKGINGDNNASYALYTGANGGLEFYVSDSSTFHLSPDAGTGVWDGSWHYVVGTYDGTAVRLYVDGVEIGNTPLTTAIRYDLPGGNDAYIGTYDGSTNHNFVGKIDEVRIWGVAIGADTISQHSKSNSVATTLETDAANQ